MAQIKQACSVVNGSQVVKILGSNFAGRILKNHIFMDATDLVPYTVASDSTFDGTDTVVTLTGSYLGKTSQYANGVFVNDYTYPDMIPVINQGDVGTAAVFTKAMYRLQSMIAAVNPDGLLQYGTMYEAVLAAKASIAGYVSTITSAASSAADSSLSSKQSADSAGASKDAAKVSETKAKVSETNSKSSEMNAALSESNAKTSETNAKASEVAAKTSETNSAGSAAAAKTSETNAKLSETAAKTSETNSKTSETNAKASETSSAASATAANGSKTAAKTSEDNAKTSETNSKTSEINSAASATAADGSKVASAASATAAKASETNAKLSETNSKTSETNAKTSETNAKTSEINAANSISSVAGYQSQSATSATQAASSAAQAAASLNSIGNTLQQANAARDQAIAAWLASAAPAENLATVGKLLHVGSVVKQFLYDTSRDSDGGAWRKRCQGKSWFAETINNAWLGQFPNELAARGDNLFLSPDDMTNTNWWSSGASVGGANMNKMSNDGTVRMQKIVDSAANTSHQVYQNLTSQPQATTFAVQYTMLKGELTKVILLFGGAGFSTTPQASVDLVAGTVTPSRGAFASIAPDPVTGGYIVTMWAQTTAAGACTCGMGLMNAAAASIYAGDGASGIYVANPKLLYPGKSLSTYTSSPELMSNGVFANNSTAGWAQSSSWGATATASAGEMQVTTTASSGRMVIPIQCTVGAIYALTATLRVINGNQAAIGASTSANGGSINASGWLFNTGASPLTGTTTFIATAATMYIAAGDNNAQAAGAVNGFSGISVKQVTQVITPYVPYINQVGNYFQNTTDGKFYTLNQSYGATETFRGNSREFPALAAVIAEANRVVIYDLAQPNCPMWMSFVQPISYIPSASCVTAINGQILVGGSTNGMWHFNFPGDFMDFRQAGNYRTNNGIASRNAMSLLTKTGASLTNNVINDITATVLDSAPLDINTGLAIPTIVVATNGGVNIIKHDGTVAGWLTTGKGYIKTAYINRHGAIAATGGETVAWSTFFKNSIPVGTDNTVDYQFDANTVPTRQGTNSQYGKMETIIETLGARALASSQQPPIGGLTLLKDNPSMPNSGMVAYINTAFNSGWMVGDIRGNWMAECNSAATPVVELVPNGNFISDINGWTNTGGTQTWVAGALRRDSAGSSNGSYIEIPVQIGYQYVVSANVTAVSGTGNVGFYVYPGGAFTPVLAYSPAVGSSSFVTPPMQTNSMRLYLYTDGTKVADFKSVSVKVLGEPMIGAASNNELVAVPNFASATGWTLESGWSISGGTLKYDGTGGAMYYKAYTNIATIPGRQYKLNLTVTAASGGSFMAQAYTNGQGTMLAQTATQTVAGTYSLVFTATTTTSTIVIQENAAAMTCTVSNFSVKQFEPENLLNNGSFDNDVSGWTQFPMTGGTFASVGGALQITAGSGTYAQVQQVVTGLIVGATYQLKADVIAGTYNVPVVQYSFGTGVTVISGAGLNQAITFQATASSVTIVLAIGAGATAGQTLLFDNISLRLAVADRSAKGNNLTVLSKGMLVNGALGKPPVAAGASLQWFANLGRSNYLEQGYNSQLDFSTGDFHVTWWENNPSATMQAYRFSRGVLGSTANMLMYVGSDFVYRAVVGGVAVVTGVTQIAGVHKIDMVRQSGVFKFFVDGQQVYSVANTADTSAANAVLRIGTDTVDGTWLGVSMALFRMSATAPSADQIAKMYADEQALFLPGAQATLDGSSSVVTGLSYDHVTDVLDAFSGTYRSSFRGLQRVSSDQPSVGTFTSASALAGVKLVGGSTGARVQMPSISLREEIRRKEEERRAIHRIPTPFAFVSTGAQATFQMQPGYTPQMAFKQGMHMTRDQDYAVTYDGFRYSVTFNSTPANNSNIAIIGVRNG